MNIYISENSELSLQDADNFKGFSIIRSQDDIDATAALRDIAEAAEEITIGLMPTKLSNYQARQRIQCG